MLKGSRPMGRWKRSVGSDDSPPRHRGAVQCEHSPHLPWTAPTHSLRDTRVRRGVTRRYLLDAAQDGFDVFLMVVTITGHIGRLCRAPDVLLTESRSVRRLRGVDLVNPGDYAAAHVHGVGESGSLEDRQRLC